MAQNQWKFKALPNCPHEFSHLTLYSEPNGLFLTGTYKDGKNYPKTRANYENAEYGINHLIKRCFYKLISDFNHHFDIINKEIERCRNGK